VNASVHEWLAAGFLLVLCALSARSYRQDHAARDYADGSRAAMPSPRGFAVVYAWIRYSTLVGGLGALLFAHPIWLVLHRSPAAIYVGAALAAAGYAMFVASRRALGRHYSPCYESYVPLAVVTEGPYARIRHPIYTANQLVLLGLTVMTGSCWMLANLVALWWFYRRSARDEEARLLQEHLEYAPYYRRTGRFLPRLFGSRAA